MHRPSDGWIEVRAAVFTASFLQIYLTGTVPGSTLENLRESLNLSNDTTDAISVLPDGQLRLEMAGDGGAEDQEVPP